jgi:hypothetical protein
MNFKQLQKIIHSIEPGFRILKLYGTISLYFEFTHIEEFSTVDEVIPYLIDEYKDWVRLLGTNEFKNDKRLFDNANKTVKRYQKYLGKYINLI